jgi:hypothetical protein
MKLQEFRKLIREEISKLITEGSVKPVDPKKLQLPLSDLELYNNVKKTHKTKLIKQVTYRPESTQVDIYQIVDTPYIVTNAYLRGPYGKPPEQRGLLFKSDDLDKLVKSIKDGFYFDLEYKEDGELPRKASNAAAQAFKSKKYVMIDKNTKLKVGDKLLGIYKGAFAKIERIVGDKYYLQFDIDYAGEKAEPRSFSVLKNNYLIKKS